MTILRQALGAPSGFGGEDQKRLAIARRFLF